MSDTGHRGVRRRLLLVDDDADFVEDASLVLSRDFECRSVSEPEAVLPACADFVPDVVLLDIDFHGEPLGYDLLTRIRAEFPFLPVIVWTDDRSVDAGIEAQARGAVHTVRKTPARNEVIPAVEFALRRSRADIHTNLLESELDRDWGTFVFASGVTAKLLEEAAQFAQAEDPILITGERGVGKGVLAMEIHNRSRRSGARFVTVDCTSIPAELAERELFGNLAGAYTGATRASPGLIDAAEGGTLFLDEVGDTSGDIQSKLRRLSEEKKFRPVGQTTRENDADVRLIAATNKDLRKAISQERFRADLYDRLATFHLHIPPLRERPEDIPVLADWFIAKRSEDTGTHYELTPDAYLFLQSREWPQNVRGLRNAIARACTLSEGGVISASDFAARPREGEEPMDLETAKQRFERSHVVKALRLACGNKTGAADLLGVSRATIHRLINKHEIAEDEWA
ncbi:MAG: response regulator [Candidatus Eisenbacteria bacterium]|nr:response regulator [Candidatus Eisenbacteria bacterium]